MLRVQGRCPKCRMIGHSKARAPVITAALLGWAALIASRRLVPVTPPLRPCNEAAWTVRDGSECDGPHSAQ